MNPRIVHVHSGGFKLSGKKLVARLAGVATILTTYHAFPPKLVDDVDKRNRGKVGVIDDTFDVLGLAYFDRALVALSHVEKAAHETTGVKGHKITVIPNGIDLTQFKTPIMTNAFRMLREKLKGKFVIGNIARLDPIKGQKDLIEAMSIILSEVPNAVLVIFGEGGLKDYLEKLIRSKKLQKKVLLFGKIDHENIPEALSLMNVFAFPSILEGQGLAMIEAMAAGLPVVASRAGGIPETLNDDAGILVKPRNPKELAAAIVRLAKDENLRKTLGQAGHKRAFEFFNIERMVRDYENLYRALLKEKGQGQRASDPDAHLRSVGSDVSYSQRKSESRQNRRETPTEWNERRSEPSAKIKDFGETSPNENSFGGRGTNDEPQDSAKPRPGYTAQDVTKRLAALEIQTDAGKSYRGFVPVKRDQLPVWLQIMLASADALSGLKGDSTLQRRLNAAIDGGRFLVGEDSMFYGANTFDGTNEDTAIYFIAVNDNPFMLETVIHELHHGSHEENVQAEWAFRKYFTTVKGGSLGAVNKYIQRRVGDPAREFIFFLKPEQLNKRDIIKIVRQYYSQVNAVAEPVWRKVGLGFLVNAAYKIGLNWGLDIIAEAVPEALKAIKEKRAREKGFLVSKDNIIAYLREHKDEVDSPSSTVWEKKGHKKVVGAVCRLGLSWPEIAIEAGLTSLPISIKDLHGKMKRVLRKNRDSPYFSAGGNEEEEKVGAVQPP
ncbi:MAG TPA: glycosyltransferase family 4 protein, partial [Candidatus Omnitrophota bacterium]|nr:glycosyltransferase family 4 protein [Candidatus Omnitrophota bacterium]